MLARAALLCAAVLGACDEPAPRNPVTYRYTGDGGKPVFVDELSKVPDQYRDTIEQVSGGSLRIIYRYPTGSGATAYTNDLHRVPPDRRADAKPVDLSHISLNNELADDLSRAIDAQYEAVLASPECQRARDDADANWFVKAWRNRPELVVIAAAVVLLLGITPFMVRRMLGAVWVRVLAVALPLLLFVGMLSYSAVSMRDVSAELSKKADPCRSDRQGPSLGKLNLARQRVEQIDRAIAMFER